MHEHFRRALEECDVALARKIWAHAMPHLPQPTSDEQALVVLHHARTQAKSIKFKLRAYSHSWLIERGLPSGLPDELKPKAERMYPVVSDAVGISVKSISGLVEVADGIRGAMSDAVMDAYADNKRDPVFVKARMFEARERKKRFYRDLLRL